MPKGEKTKKLWSDPSFRKKMSLAALGKSHSNATKEKMRLAKVGYIPWNKGKKDIYSKSTIRKMRVARLGKKFPPLTKIHKKRISMSLKGRKRLFMIGNKNHNWRGGITPLHISIRNCPEMDVWRLKIFKRDYFTCRVCNKKVEKIHAHHLNHFTSILKENNISTIEEAVRCKILWDVDNGITICIPCHIKIHKKNGN